MGYFKSILLTASLLMMVSFAFSQTSNENEKLKEQNQKAVVKQTPSVTHTVLTGGKPSEITAKVIELAQGDDVTAEKVVKFIKVDRKPTVTKIVSDEEYKSMGRDVPAGVMSESEVIELIIKLK